MFGKAIPAPQRGPFFARRNLWAEVVGFGAGLVVRQFLNEGPELLLVEHYAWLISVAAMCFALAASESRHRRRRPSAVRRRRLHW